MEKNAPGVGFLEGLRFLTGPSPVVAGNQFELIRVFSAMFDFSPDMWALSQLRTLRRAASKTRW